MHKTLGFWLRLLSSGNTNICIVKTTCYCHGLLYIDYMTYITLRTKTITSTFFKSLFYESTRTVFNASTTICPMILCPCKLCPYRFTSTFIYFHVFSSMWPMSTHTHLCSLLYSFIFTYVHIFMSFVHIHLHPFCIKNSKSTSV